MSGSEKSEHDEATPTATATPTAQSELPIDSDKDVERGLSVDAAVKSAEATENPNVVSWDGPDDPENPQNWPFRRKAAAVGIVSAITFIRCAILCFFICSATRIVSYVTNLHQPSSIVCLRTWHRRSHEAVPLD